MLIPFWGSGDGTAVATLTIYGIMPMVRNTYTGITRVNKEIIMAAKDMGSTEIQIMLKIKLPLALGVILVGGGKKGGSNDDFRDGNCFLYRSRRTGSCHLQRNYYLQYRYDVRRKLSDCLHCAFGRPFIGMLGKTSEKTLLIFNGVKNREAKDLICVEKRKSKDEEMGKISSNITGGYFGDVSWGMCRKRK